jgi:uroporphyrinogen-III synthase
MTEASPLILVTRSEPGASATAERLVEAGLRAIRTPMLATVDRPLPADLEGVQALLVTSAHAARRLAEAPRPLPRVLTVGGATAEAARAAGAEEVRSADGDVEALAVLARRVLHSAHGPVLHWRGENVAGDLTGALEHSGFTVRHAIVYAAEPAAALSPEAADALRGGEAAGVLFHSARGARAFIDAVGRAGLTDRVHGLVAASLSSEAGAPARETAFAKHVSAAQPLEKSLLEALTAALNIGC